MLRLTKEVRGICAWWRTATGATSRKQCCPLASGSPWWGWHHSLRMRLAHVIANGLTVLSVLLVVQVPCLLSSPSFSRNVTPGSTRRAGVLASTSGGQRCSDGMCPHALVRTTARPLSGERGVRDLLILLKNCIYMLWPSLWDELDYISSCFTLDATFLLPWDCGWYLLHTWKFTLHCSGVTCYIHMN